jgi:hypothetical protein
VIWMYNNPAPVMAAGAAGTLAFTGGNVVWSVLAGFALIAVGSAISRMLPRRSDR